MKFSEREPPMPIVNAWRLGMSDGTVRFSAYLSGGGLIPGRSADWSSSLGLFVQSHHQYAGLLGLQ